MKITAEINPIISYYKEEAKKPINVNKIVNELNELLTNKDYYKLGAKTDRELNPEIKWLTLTLHATQEEVNNAPDYLKNRLKLDVK
jgi:hypothetical protein